MVKYSSAILAVCSAQLASSFLAPSQVRLHVGRDTTLRLVQRNSPSGMTPREDTWEEQKDGPVDRYHNNKWPTMRPHTETKLDRPRSRPTGRDTALRLAQSNSPLVMTPQELTWEEQKDGLNVDSFMDDLEDMSEELDVVLANKPATSTTKIEEPTEENLEIQVAPSVTVPVRLESKDSSNPVGAFSLLAVALTAGMVATSPEFGSTDWSTLSAALGSVDVDFSSGAAFFSKMDIIGSAAGNFDFSKMDFSSVASAASKVDFSILNSNLERALVGLVPVGEFGGVNPLQMVNDALGSVDFSIAKSNLDNALAGFGSVRDFQVINPLQVVLERTLPQGTLSLASIQEGLASTVAQTQGSLKIMQQEVLAPSNQMWQDAAGRFASSIHPEEWAANTKEALAAGAVQVQDAIPQAMSSVSDAVAEMKEGAALKVTEIQTGIPAVLSSLKESWANFKEGMITLWERFPLVIGDANVALASTANQIEEAIPQIAKGMSDSISDVPRIVAMSTDATVNQMQHVVSDMAQKMGEVPAMLSNVRVSVPEVNDVTGAMTNQAAAFKDAVPDFGAIVGSIDAKVVDMKASVPDANDLWGAVATKVADVQVSVQDVTVPEVSSVMESVTTKTTEMKASLQDLSTPDINDMVSTVAAKSEAMKDSLIQVPAPEVEPIKNVVTATVTDVVPPMKEVPAAVTPSPVMTETVQSQMDRMEAALLSR